MKGALLINTGSPESNNPQDLKKFQDEILKDPRVINPAHGIPELSSMEVDSQYYKNLSFQEKSESFLKKIQEKTNIPIALAIHYGNLTIKDGLQDLVNQGVTEALVIPLFPQYSFATNEAVNDKVEEIVSECFPKLDLKFFLSFYDYYEYIQAVAKNISETLKDKKYDHIVFSYHGVPEYFSMERDFTKNQCQLNGYCCNKAEEEPEFCYITQCFESSSLIASELNINFDMFSTSFQSRLGLETWLQPTTQRTIENLAKNGAKKLAIVFPGFVTDCQDTLKMTVDGREIFLNNGGEEFIAIPSLNDGDNWVDAITRWIDHWRIVDLKTAIA